MDRLTFESLAANQPRRAVVYSFKYLGQEAKAIECVQCAVAYVATLPIAHFDASANRIIAATEVCDRSEVRFISCPTCKRRMEFE